MFKYSAKKATQVLNVLDRVANLIEDNYERLQIPEKVAAEILTTMDGVADDIQLTVGGEDSFKEHVARVLKAEVLQKESDEPYMDTFKNPMQPRQVERDEPYMDAYEDDQSSAVIHGKSSTNQPLTPNHR